MAAVQPHKRQRVDYDHYVTSEASTQPGTAIPVPTFATHNAAIAHQQAILPADLWTTVSSLPETAICETLFHAATGSMTHSQLLFSVFDMHHQRLRGDADAATTARKAEEARIKREKNRVVNFDWDVRQIEDWLDDEHPNYFEKRISTPAINLCTRKLEPRIAKIKEKATSQYASFGTRCSALKALCGIAEAMCKAQYGAIGCNVICAFSGEHDDVSKAMLAVLESMSREEVEKARDWNGPVTLAHHIERVWNMGQLDQEIVAFKKFEEVLEVMGWKAVPWPESARNPGVKWRFKLPRVSYERGSGINGLRVLVEWV